MFNGHVLTVYDDGSKSENKQKNIREIDFLSFYTSFLAFGLLPQFFLWCGPRGFWFGSTKLEWQTNLVMLHIGKSNVGLRIRRDFVFVSHVRQQHYDRL